MDFTIIPIIIRVLYLIILSLRVKALATKLKPRIKKNPRSNRT